MLWLPKANRQPAYVYGNGLIQAHGGSAAAWYPTDAATAMTVFFDSNRGVTESGGDISQWDDQSGNARHATQSTGANQPNLISSGLNGKSIVRYTRANSDKMTFGSGVNTVPQASAWTIFFAAKLNTFDANIYGLASLRSGFAGTDTDMPMLYWNGVGYADFSFGARNASTTTWAYRPSFTFTNRTNWHWFILEHNGSGSFTAENDVGALTVYDGSNRATNTGNTLGYDGNGYFDGDMRFFGVYGGLLSAGDKTSLRTFLDTETGL